MRVIVAILYVGTWPMMGIEHSRGKRTFELLQIKNELNRGGDSTRLGRKKEVFLLVFR